MDLADRIAAMTADLPQPITVGELRRYAADQSGRRRLAFDVDVGDNNYFAEVAIIPRSAPQEQIDAFAGALRSLLAGSEGRVADAEQRIARQRGTINAQDAEIQKLRAQLADFEVSRAARGPFYAIEDANGAVWLVGRPSSAAWGLHYRSWAEVARDRPGLRPCGTCPSADPNSADLYIVMLPIADLEKPCSAAT
jgi:hypothetical protein